MSRKLASGGLGLTAVLGLSVLTAVAAPAEVAAVPVVSAVSAANDELSAVADSASLNTPVVARGTVFSASGVPAPSTQVVMYAWPAEETVSAAVEGDTLKLQPVAKAMTAADGSYSLKLTSLSQLAPSAGSDGTVTLETVAVTADSDPAVFNFSRALTRTGSSSSTSLAAPAETPYTEPGGNNAYYAGYRLTDPMAEDGVTKAPPVANSSIYLGSQDATDSTATAADASDKNPGSAPVCTGKNCGGEYPGPITTSAELPTSSATAASAVQKDGCSAQLISKLNPVWGLVGTHYSTTTAVTVGFKYTSGASSTLGVIVKAKGLKLGGTTTDESEGTITYPNAAGPANVYRRTQFRYGRFRIICLAGLSATTWEEYRETDWLGGAETRYPSSPPSATYCTPYQKGASLEKKSTAATGWTNGIDLTAAGVGLDASIKTGFTSKTSVTFTFAQARKLCGTNDYPGQSPGQMVAKS